jgi:hypothetical protein
MSDTTRALLERRSHARIVAKGAVSFGSSNHAQRGRVANLGKGGMFVLTSATVPDRLRRRAVDFQIRLDGGHAEWLRGTGEIVRIHSRGMAVAFDTPPIALLRVIDHLASAARANVRIMSVVLIDVDETRRSAMAAGFRATGCSVVEAATPLEAVVRLGEAMFEPDVIAVADSQTAAEMRLFVEREHPGTKLLTIGDELFAPDGIAHWLSAAPYVDRSSRIREVRALHA